MRQVRKYLVPHHSNNFHPHLFRTTGVLIAIVTLIGVFFISSKLLVNLPKLGSFAAVYAGMVIAYTNDNREVADEPSFVPNDLLTQAAQLKANDMAERGYFSHNSPDGRRFWYWMEQVGYNYKYAGENLAIDFVDSKDVTNAWMSSPGHRANILNSDFKEIGVATAVGMYQGRETTFVVQMFGTPAVKSAKVATTPPQQVQMQQASVAIPEAVEKRVEGAYTDRASLFEKMIASPKRNIIYLYYFFASLVAGLVLLGAAIEFKRHHKGIWLAGGVLISVAIILISFFSRFGLGII